MPARERISAVCGDAWLAPGSRGIAIAFLLCARGYVGPSIRLGESAIVFPGERGNRWRTRLARAIFRYMAKYGNEITLEGLAEIASALGEPKRLMALAMLSRGERCLCDLTEGLGLSSSTVSNHMAILKRAGLVEARKDGRWMHFRLADSSSGSGAPQALAWVLDLLPESIKSSTCCAKDSCCP